MSEHGEVNTPQIAIITEIIPTKIPGLPRLNHISIIDNKYSLTDTPTLPKLPETEKCLQLKALGQKVADPDQVNSEFRNSDINSLPKFTEEISNCLGIVLVGKNKNGNNVSSLWHVIPEAFKGADSLLEISRKSEFIIEYRKFLKNFNKETSKESRSAIIAGGRYDPIWGRYSNYNDRYPLDSRLHINMVRTLQNLHKKELGILTNVFPARKGLGHTNIYVGDTDIYVVNILKDKK